MSLVSIISYKYCGKGDVGIVVVEEEEREREKKG